MFLNRIGGQIDTTASDDTILDTTDVPEVATSVRGLIQQANNYFNSALQAQRSGNWAEYGRNQQLLEQVLKQLEENTQE